MRRISDAEVQPTLRPMCAEEPRPRSRWEAPTLLVHGDVRALTLGLSSGNIESGAPGTFRP